MSLLSIRTALALGGAAVLAAGCKQGTSRARGESRGEVAAGNGDVGWPAYTRDLAGQRFAELKEITERNVAGLKPVCLARLGEEGTFQSGPVVAGDTLFVTTPHTTVALNATNCALVWRHVDAPKSADVYPVNRGAAYANGRLYRGTPDGRLVALDARTGNVVWDVQAGDPKRGEFMSSAPVVWRNTVFTGVAGSDWGVRGHMMAFDAATGKEKWRFWTVPEGDEPGADTWQTNDSTKRVGGAQWTSYALDEKTGELFVPVANPAPDFAPQTRPGANLYTNALVVLDASTGALKWYYQLDPHDGLDWDLGAAPVLLGDDRVLLGSKDGNVYVLDRASHKPLFKTPVTTIQNPGAAPTVEGVDVCPGPLGGVEWNSPAYSPDTKLVYAGAVDWCGRYQTAKSNDDIPYKPGQLYMGTTYAPPPGATATGWLTAVDAQSGRVKWRFHAPQPIVAGVTPTAGGVVFNGDLAGNLYAFDAQSGKVLYTYPTKGAIAGGIVTYGVRGTQYVATTSGNISRTTFQTAGTPTIIVFSLHAPATPSTVTLPAYAQTSGGASPTEHAEQGAAKGSTTGKK
jgi:alcohol dehydrogenase (cytochrome c)